MRYLPKKKIKYAYLSAVLLLLIAAFLGLVLGSVPLSFDDLLRALTGDADTPEARILWYVRLPRACAGILCGAAFSVAGAVIQGVLANRLASPSIIGVNAGAGLAVTICAVFGIIGGFSLSLFAFLGALFSVMLVSLCATKWAASRGTVILMGVALNSFLGAIADAITSFVPEIAVMNNDFKVGDFSFVTYDQLLPAAVIILISLSVLLSLTGELDVLTLGDENASGLGMNPTLMRTLFLIFAALLSGAAVSVAGLLSFVGLLVPHAVRRVSSAQSKHLLPLCALFGGGFVSLCDTLARTVFAPYEIPVGIIMAFLGAPFFIFILFKGRGGHRHA